MDRRSNSESVELRNQGMKLPAWKRALDLTLILVMSPGLLILGAGTALLVMCGSRGPIMFRQRRVGYKGRQFTCYKFRTMHVDADTGPHREHAGRGRVEHSFLRPAEDEVRRNLPDAVPHDVAENHKHHRDRQKRRAAGRQRKEARFHACPSNRRFSR